MIFCLVVRLSSPPRLRRRRRPLDLEWPCESCVAFIVVVTTFEEQRFSDDSIVHCVATQGAKTGKYRFVAIKRS